MNDAHFDLRDRDWLPARQGSEVSLVGLRELFLRAHEIDDLVVPIPPAAAGIWRILYAITARVTGLDEATLSADEWAERRDAVISKGIFDPTAVAAYLDSRPNRYDLFDEHRPWMQDPRLRAECPKPAGVNKLVLGRPAGRNQVWFGHFNGARQTPLAIAEAAWWLIAQTYYGASGQCGSRTVAGQTFTNTFAGPLRSVLSIHPIGRTVFESLVAGLPGPELASGLAEVADRCPWEADDLSDPLGMPPVSGWPGGLLTGRGQHALLLVPNSNGEHVTDAYLTWARRAPAHPARDPYLLWRQSKAGAWFSPRADATRSLWRDLDALLRHSGPDTLRPAVIDSCLDLPYWPSIRLRAFGFDQDGQTRDKLWFTATTPEVLRWVEERDHVAAGGVAALRQAAESVAGSLKFALATAWQEVAPTAKRGNDGPWAPRALERYWSDAEREFWQRMDERAFEKPRRAFVDIALRTIDTVTAQQQRQPRIAAAISRARSIVASTPKATRQRRKASA